MLSRISPDTPAVIESRRFRDVLGSFTTGVIVVTTVNECGHPVGLTVNSFNSLSLDPPLILWSLSLKAPSLNSFRSTGHFVINILSSSQQRLCKVFSTPSENKFENVGFVVGLGGVPILKDTVAHMVCRTYSRYPGGDHEIYVGEVLEIEDRNHAPLVFHRGSFHELSTEAQQQIS
jgi:3-hydroxy-9,10-secoandrosta-1,3,5(10)-triene-9,17-dione monooxygenase reductase component